MEARVPQQPSLDQGCLVGSVVVEDEMDFEFLRHVVVDCVEELPKLDAAVAPMMLRDHLAALDVERSEERCGAVADVVVRSALDLPRSQRQDRLRTIQSLNLRLLVNAEDRGTIGRIQVEAHDVPDLLDQQRVRREFEALAAVWSQTEGAPNPGDAAPTQASSLGQRARTPMRGVLGLGLESQRDHVLHCSISDLARRARPRLIQQTIHAAFDETRAPTANRLTEHAKTLRHLRVVSPVRAGQDDPSPQSQCLRGASSPRQALQLLSLLSAQHQRRLRPSLSHRRSPSIGERARARFSSITSGSGH